MRIDLNADVGEDAGDDEALLGVVTSANVSCGAHAGDVSVIEKTIVTAQRCGVAVGAHPSYPDSEGFGRRSMDMTPAQVERSVSEQLEFLAAIAQTYGAQLRHVKPHGALYNDAAGNRALAEAIARAVAAFDDRLILVGLAGSEMIDAADSAGLASAAEAFCDRAYEADGSLRSRMLEGALKTDADEAAAQALAIVLHKRVQTTGGIALKVDAQTLCIHGDTPGAPAIARAVRSALENAGVEVAPL